MRKLLLAVTALMITFAAKAQVESHVRWSYAAKKTSATEAVVLIKATIDKGWHIYSQTVKEGGPIKTSFTFAPSKEYAIVGTPSEPKPITHFEKVFNMNVGYFENSVIFQQKIKLKSPKASAVKGKLEFMTCNDSKCLPPDEVEFSIPLGK
ncbi:protein-disulfide reductase DsbD N-terminal domain-containing protein [Mucilaginibacter sp. RB4R14]|uniref:protein-disulfide reductase DsbD N-terminal domain-containing protein n=1 Tax=Mucilaginibacter aurantiaciroseus TaxID=2949308 RepID=UPI0020904AF7|nr:protein-disulfide reductase DsbD N-terminal domain-containing protein [Mucilaginibacter aurantiaciroseus]MCO5936704.1 protein-disulfide reductase DsbD N-terminal domain-containing protein [Mucilaginibacter aurantiaciroseus]